MTQAEQALAAFKQAVIDNCNNPDFEYREWFVKDHLEIVERIAMELCDKHPEADRELVLALAWFHDFGKPIDQENERRVTRTKGAEALRSAGFVEDFARRVVESWERMEMKDKVDLSKESIEVQIVSTADGASHFVGKFYATYFMDDPNEGMDGVVERLRNKITKDWEKKVVLPEAKEAFRDRYMWAKEMVGEYPDRFIP